MTNKTSAIAAMHRDHRSKSEAALREWLEYDAAEDLGFRAGLDYRPEQRLSLERVCLHEAAHAVADVVHACGVEKVIATERGGTSVPRVCEGTCTRCKSYRWMGRDALARFERAGAVIFLAGVAQDGFVTDGSATDVVNAVRSLGGTEAPRIKMRLLRAFERAQRLVGEYETSIAALAEELQRKEVILGDRVDAIVRTTESPAPLQRPRRDRA